MQLTTTIITEVENEDSNLVEECSIYNVPPELKKKMDDSLERIMAEHGMNSR